MHNVTDERHMLLARRVKALWSRYQRSRDLVSVGAYVPGSDAETDQALALFPRIAAMLQQEMHEQCTLEQARGALEAVLGPSGDR
jgi:flagellum-specific ATP synthase